MFDRIAVVATVQPGYLSRGRVRSVPSGTHWLIQAKDVSEEAGVLLDHAARFHPERKPELYQINRGDILVVARGQDHRAHFVNQNLPNALAAATFYIVRPDPGRVLSGFLAWWLNLPHVQAEIGASSRGTSIAYISREAIEALEIPIPPLSVQETIDRVIALWRKKKSLQFDLDQKHEQYIDIVCRRAVRESTEE